MSSSVTSAEDATALKQKGNTAFANHDWPKAVDLYTQAIHMNGEEPSFYCNRAQAGSFICSFCHFPPNEYDNLGEYKAGVIWLRNRRCIQSD